MVEEISKKIFSKIFKKECTSIEKDFENEIVKIYFKDKSIEILDFDQSSGKLKKWASEFNSDVGGKIGGFKLFSRYGNKWNKAACYNDNISDGIETSYKNTEFEAVLEMCIKILNKYSK